MSPLSSLCGYNGARLYQVGFQLRIRDQGVHGKNRINRTRVTRIIPDKNKQGQRQSTLSASSDFY